METKSPPSGVRSGLTDFGFRQVSQDEKTHLVGEVFKAAAGHYDLMNDLMSLGSHRLLKDVTLQMSAVRPGHKVLDLAGGTGDMAMRFADRVGPEGEVVLADINKDMLTVARDRLADLGYADIHLVQADAESLPMPEATFDLVVTAFGLRNVTRKEQALLAIHNCLKPGGRFLVLEFSKPKNALVGAAFEVGAGLWPLLGKVVAGDAAPYRYLVESISTHPNQETLTLMLEDAGFSQVRCHDLMGGVVALHIGDKVL